MTTTTQQLLRDIALFNMVFPVGSTIAASLTTGVTAVKVSGAAHLLNDEPYYKATYGKNFTTLLQCQSVQIPQNYFADWFNERYPVGCKIKITDEGVNPYATIISNAYESMGLYVPTNFGVINIHDFDLTTVKKEVQNANS